MFTNVLQMYTAVNATTTAGSVLAIYLLQMFVYWPGFSYEWVIGHSSANVIATSFLQNFHWIYWKIIVKWKVKTGKLGNSSILALAVYRYVHLDPVYRYVHLCHTLLITRNRLRPQRDSTVKLYIDNTINKYDWHMTRAVVHGYNLEN